jgi:hypothetical protein
MVKHHQTPWSKIIKTQNHKSSKTLSTIIKNDHQQSSKTEVKSLKIRVNNISESNIIKNIVAIIEHQCQNSSNTIIKNHQTP